jgi:bifunctional UDP-N-acetylglucosamine pyrophosphorylase/glucosamine-1-phosphate N-acetyltransferase
MGEAIRSYFGDGSRFGFKIGYVEQQAVLGTGNAASLAEPFVSGDFLLVYGDLLFSQEAIKAVLETYAAGNAAAAMAVVPVDKPESYGIIEPAPEKTVKRIIEKPPRESAPSNLVNAGLYVFSPEVFEALRRVKRSPRGEWELTDAITQMAEEGKRVLAAELTKGDWFDVGRPWDLLMRMFGLSKNAAPGLGRWRKAPTSFGRFVVAKTARIRSGATSKVRLH